MLIIPTLGYGGAEALVLSWIRHWVCSAAVDKVILVLYSDLNLDRLKDIREHPKFCLEIEDSNTPWKIFRPRYIRHLIRLRRIILKHDPDIVHSNLGVNIDLALLFRLLPKHIKIVHTVHCPADHDGKGKYRHLLKPLYRSSRVTPVSISSTVQDTFSEYYGLASRLIYNGIDRPSKTSLFDKTKAEVAKLAKGEDGSPTHVFLAVGRVMYPKNYELMTAVFQRLHKEGQKVTLIVLGDLINDDNRKRYLPLERERIFFLGGKNNVGDYLRCCDFFCMTSLFEGFGLALAEAMSVGVIPIITPSSGMLETLRTSSAGIVSQDYSIDSYHQAVIDGLNLSEKKKESLRQCLVATFEKNFTIEICANRYLGLFQEIFLNSLERK